MGLGLSIFKWSGLVATEDIVVGCDIIIGIACCCWFSQSQLSSRR